MSEIKPKKFASIHNHSQMSTFDGFGAPSEHLDFVLENGMDAFAFSEHGNMSSFAAAYIHTQNLKKTGRNIKLIPALEAYYHPDLDQWRHDKELAANDKNAEKEKEDDEERLTVEDEDASKRKKQSAVNRRHHLVLFARNQKGIENLFALVSRSNKEGFYRFPRIDLKMLREHGEGIGISTACVAGPLAADVYNNFDVPRDDLGSHLITTNAQLQKIVDEIGEHAGRIVDCIGGPENFFVELQFNKLPAQHLANMAYMELAKRGTFKLIAAADSHYCRPEFWKDREMYKALAWLGRGDFDPSKLPQTIDDLKCELYPKNADQMWESYKKTSIGYSFYDDSVVCDAIERTHDIAHGLIGDVSFDTSMKLPSFVVPNGKTATQALVELCKDGLRDKRLDKKSEYIERIKKEIAVIDKLKFSAYFLTVRAIINVAQQHMMVSCGRGSGAGSLVNYVLGITNVDPIKYELVFERFLNLQRVGQPDIDTDVSDRDRLMGLLKTEFGSDSVLPISTYGSFKVKSLIKDISKFYGIEFQEVNEALKTVDSDCRSALFKKGENKSLFSYSYDEAYKHCERLRNFINRHPNVGAHAQRLLDQPRSIGKHAGGIVILDDAWKKIPLITSKGELQVPWVEGVAAKNLEELGYCKIDMLGIKTLRIIERTAERIIKKEQKKKNSSTDQIKFSDVKKWIDDHLDPEKLDLNDEKMYKYVYDDGNFAGVFQFTEQGVQDFVKRVKPRNVTDIAAVTSIYRPGPLAAHVDKTYVKSKTGEREQDFKHPLISDCLSSTYGQLIFQEQITTLGNRVANMSFDDCDRLRKALSKRTVANQEKADEETVILEKQFIEGAISNGVQQSDAEKLFARMKAFISYSFNLSLEKDTLVPVYDANGKFIEDKRIESIVPGDLVMSRDESTRSNKITPVVALHDHGELDVYEWTMSDGAKVTCTPNHKFRTTDGRMLPISLIKQMRLEIVTIDKTEKNRIVQELPVA